MLVHDNPSLYLFALQIAVWNWLTVFCSLTGEPCLFLSLPRFQNFILLQPRLFENIERLPLNVLHLLVVSSSHLPWAMKQSYLQLGEMSRVTWVCRSISIHCIIHTQKSTKILERYFKIWKGTYINVLFLKILKYFIKLPRVKLADFKVKLYS